MKYHFLLGSVKDGKCWCLCVLYPATAVPQRWMGLRFTLCFSLRKHTKEEKDESCTISLSVFEARLPDPVNNSTVFIQLRTPYLFLPLFFLTLQSPSCLTFHLSSAAPVYAPICLRRPIRTETLLPPCSSHRSATGAVSRSCESLYIGVVSALKRHQTEGRHPLGDFDVFSSEVCSVKSLTACQMNEMGG